MVDMKVNTFNLDTYQNPFQIEKSVYKSLDQSIDTDKSKQVVPVDNFKKRNRA